MMRRSNRPRTNAWGLASLLTGMMCLSAQADTAPPDDLAGAWQHHKASFNYFGSTTLYTCDGLRGKVKQILLSLGARKDLKVFAGGCFGPDSTPSRSVIVNMNFFTLAPRTANVRWAPVALTPRDPSFLGDGDCELIQEMKDLISKNFNVRDMEYTTDCVPGQIVRNSFAIKGQIPQPM
jgi:hypothetical protein